MSEKTLLKVGVIGAVVTAVCCFTPVLIILLGTLGLSALVGYLDYVLFPALVAGRWSRWRGSPPGPNALPALPLAAAPCHSATGRSGLGSGLACCTPFPHDAPESVAAYVIFLMLGLDLTGL